jgi:hypothetical protein
LSIGPPILTGPPYSLTKYVVLLNSNGVINGVPLKIAGLPRVSRYQFTELLNDDSINDEGLMYDVSLIVMGGDVKLILIILRFSF